ncbi:insulin-like growth factor-binding protein 3 [Astyanax mexicanus]|uniref:Insulin-like growth factor-binding protein 3 n=1 Tax=Astyanax mexicanus TaxID=7994 RepID=A0A8T2MKZ8_ASTMX|nr:insulin-like growth factor-binding protein 3 [Astyanax mexicanus]KAG9282675.1 insulin-like growth factor-binding protein 3 [Astyanax mexicanus]
MTAAQRALCLAALLAAASAAGRTARASGPVVRCEPCDEGALVQCKPLPRECAERVREPGCGCCMTCALAEGQPCGVYTGRCGAGLTCQYRPGETKPLQALLEGRGVCAKAPRNKPAGGVVARGNESHVVPEQERLSNSTVATVTEGIEVAQRTATDSGLDVGSQRTVLEPKGSLLHTKLGIIQKEQSKNSQSYKVESVASSVHTDIHNFSLESKRETEYGPCRREMESVLKSLKISNVLNPRFFRIPNCDRKGFYKKKQCRPSKGRRRGYCWCVDKYGQALPGYEGKEQGQVHCYNLEKK